LPNPEPGFPCHETCKECDGPEKTDCTACDPLKGLTGPTAEGECKCESVKYYDDASN